MSKVIITSESELDLLIQNAVKKVLQNLPKNESPTSSIYLNLKEAAAFLNLSSQTLYQFTSTRRISFFKKGKKLYFLKEDLLKWLEEGRKSSKREIIEGFDKKGENNE